MATETHRAVGERTADGTRVTPNWEIPALDEWVRDYVDRRSVTDGMVVLEAQVAGDDVEALTINAACASKRAKRLDDTDADVGVSHDL